MLVLVTNAEKDFRLKTPGINRHNSLTTVVNQLATEILTLLFDEIIHLKLEKKLVPRRLPPYVIPLESHVYKSPYFTVVNQLAMAMLTLLFDETIHVKQKKTLHKRLPPCIIPLI